MKRPKYKHFKRTKDLLVCWIRKIKWREGKQRKEQQVAFKKSLFGLMYNRFEMDTKGN